MPKLSDGVPTDRDALKHRWGSLLGRPELPRAMMPANVNSRAATASSRKCAAS